MLHAMQEEVSVPFCLLLEAASSCQLNKMPHSLPGFLDSISWKTCLRLKYNTCQTVNLPYCLSRIYLPVKKRWKQLLKIT